MIYVDMQDLMYNLLKQKMKRKRNGNIRKTLR
jgi:hypothetical protein